jgi:hypothetical protein
MQFFVLVSFLFIKSKYLILLIHNQTFGAIISTHLFTVYEPRTDTWLPEEQLLADRDEALVEECGVCGAAQELE